MTSQIETKYGGRNYMLKAKEDAEASMWFSKLKVWTVNIFLELISLDCC